MTQTIVLIESNPSVQSIAETVLKDAGYTLLHLPPTTSVEDLRRANAKLILCAKDFLGKTAFAACRELKRQPEFSAVKIVVFGPRANEKELNELAKDFLVDALLLTPFCSGELLQVVQKLLPSPLRH